MQRLNGIGVTVAGAGALGLTIAFTLARAGARVTVWDPAPLGDNASGISAGMLAPVIEAALDRVSRERFALMMAARDLWPGLAEAAGLPLDQSGAVLAGAGALELGRLQALGMRANLTPEGLFTPEDWRLDPRVALTALAAGAGVVVRQAALAEPAGLTVVATGAAECGLAPELACLTPIKGHILRYPGGPSEGPVVRRRGVYVCPDPGGALAGSTMEMGVNDRRIDPDKVASVHAKACDLVPALAGLTPIPEAGVRAATPDGLPLVGWSAREEVFVAAGARRNGWLLAPLVASMTAAYLAGEDPGPWAVAMDARRFDL